MQLLQVIRHLALQHRCDLFVGSLINGVALDRQVRELSLLGGALEDDRELVVLEAVVIQVELVDELRVVHEVVSETLSVTLVELQVSQDEGLVNDLAQDRLRHRLVLRTRRVVLHARILNIRVRPLGVLRLLAQLVKGLLSPELVEVLVDRLLIALQL